MRVDLLIEALLVVALAAVGLRLWTMLRNRRRRQRRRQRRQRNLVYQRLWNRFMVYPRMKQLGDGRALPARVARARRPRDPGPPPA